jgi:CBS domain containing-hemolysin-like protein
MAGKIPEVGEEVGYENMRIAVLEREGPRLGRLRVLRDPPGEILRRSEEEIIARGNLTLTQLSAALGQALNGTGEVTLNEVLVSRLEGHPERGATVSYGDLELTVLEANGDRVHKVRVVSNRG